MLYRMGSAGVQCWTHGKGVNAAVAVRQSCGVIWTESTLAYASSPENSGIPAQNADLAPEFDSSVEFAVSLFLPDLPWESQHGC